MEGQRTLEVNGKSRKQMEKAQKRQKQKKMERGDTWRWENWLKVVEKREDKDKWNKSLKK